MSPPSPIERYAALVGRPATVQVLKDKPGRRRTVRLTGRRGSVIVKWYASDRAATVAARVAALAAGPRDPAVPALIHLDVDSHTAVLTDMPGTPLGDAIEAGDLDACHRAGAAVGRWHRFWLGHPPSALRAHSVDRELAILHDRADAAPAGIAAAVRRAAIGLDASWTCTTAVHRDLYEQQILVGDRVALIDLDDAAAGPPELDVGNLLAHLYLAGHRNRRRLAAARAALMDGYLAAGPPLNAGLLIQCVSLALLRLACIHTEPALIELAACPVDENTLMVASCSGPTGGAAWWQ
ncbi:MAG: phosphotransferase [Acidimicrobiales bacterium]